MKAVVYRGPRNVSVEDVPDPRIEQKTDALVQVRLSNICGCDLHVYEGRTDLQPGRVLGHENLGEVIAVGPCVSRVRVGDWVCIPFNIACGTCRNCQKGLTAYCLTANPDGCGAAYGFAGMGPYQGGQAELLRVPYADFNCLKLPEDAQERQLDYVMLADIFPTGYHATELAGLRSGQSVVIYGAGPVGLMAALSAQIKGASKVMIVDRCPDRLQLAEQLGVIPINYSLVDPIDHIRELTGGEGADCGCECVGHRAQDAQGLEHPNLTLNALVRSVRAAGSIGVVGTFAPQDPRATDALARQGQLVFDWGLLWSKGQRLATGPTNVKTYNRQLLDLIVNGRAIPSFLVSHQLALKDAPAAYQHFGARAAGWTKVVLQP